MSAAEKPTIAGAAPSVASREGATPSVASREGATQPRAPRRKLPNRRQAVRDRLDWIDPASGNVMAIYVGAGVDPVDGTVREIFMRPAGKLGKQSLLERILDAAAVSLSLNLQFGMTVYELADALGAAQSTTNLGNASPIEEAVIHACRLQAQINGWPPGAATMRPPDSVPKTEGTK